MRFAHLALAGLLVAAASSARGFRLAPLLLQFRLAGLLVAAASSAQAQITVYTNLASFQAAAGSTTLEDFSGAALFNTTGAFGPTAYNGFSLTGNGQGNNIGVHTGSVANSGPDTAIPASFNGQNFFGWGNGAGNFIGPLTITFNQPTTAFAFDWFNTDTTDRYQISFAPGGNTYTNPPFSFTSSGFFGVVSTTPLTSATISVVTFGGYVSDEGFDNVRVSAPAAVPEPGSIALLTGIGTMGAAFLRRRNISRKAA